jgi:hypothetical protein
MDAPTQPNVIHINTMPEDMRFSAQGPRILTDGKTIPLPDDFLKSIVGLHIPYDLGLTPRLVIEMFRTLQSGGTAKYAPSMHVRAVSHLFRAAGFVNIRDTTKAPMTLYRGRSTFPTNYIEAIKP